MADALCFSDKNWLVTRRGLFFLVLFQLFERNGAQLFYRSGTETVEDPQRGAWVVSNGLPGEAIA
jgi:hypothetical protein